MSNQRLIILKDRTLGTIAPEVYGHFIEHLGHCIYDGVWVGTNSNIPNIDGIRRETVDVLRAVSAPLIRWPGGYFADCYDWHDGIGPVARRTVRFQETEPNSEEPNCFGTHEFMHLCELTGAAPNLCVNTATLTAQDAMNWVEYCNHSGSTSYAERRRKNGQKKPWGVVYWAIGNESYCLHQPQDYVQNYLLWRKYMRRVDPKIKFIASLIEPKIRSVDQQPFFYNCDWLQEVIAGIRENMEMASLHLYTYTYSGANFSIDEYWDDLAKIEQRNKLRIESFLGSIDTIVGDQRVRLALDEWGLWHPGTEMMNDCNQACTHRDAIFAARYFHLLQRYPSRIGMATIAQTVNVLHALLRTDGERSYRTPTFYVFEMFKDHQGGTALEFVHTSPRRKIIDSDILMTEDKYIDYITVSVSLSQDGKQMLITFTNADLDDSYQYDIEIHGEFVPCSTSVSVLAANPHDQNTYTEPEKVKTLMSSISITTGTVSIRLPPSSVVALSLTKAETGNIFAE